MNCGKFLRHAYRPSPQLSAEVRLLLLLLLHSDEYQKIAGVKINSGTLETVTFLQVQKCVFCPPVT